MAVVPLSGCGSGCSGRPAARPGGGDAYAWAAASSGAGPEADRADAPGTVRPGQPDAAGVIVESRIIVVGYRDQVRDWRRMHGLSEREVWPVHFRSEALRGLDSRRVSEVVFLPVFWDWPPEEQLRIMQQLVIAMRPEIRRRAA